MPENQKDNRDQQSDRKSQEQGGKKKRELNPNNPTANQKGQQGSYTPKSESESKLPMPKVRPLN